MFMALLPIEKNTDNKILRTMSVSLPFNGKMAEDGSALGGVGVAAGAKIGYKKIDKKLCKFLDDMKETMYAAEGIGLAAPQVSQNIRVVICRFNHDSDHEIVVDMVNPEIIGNSGEKKVHEEGCLSLPGEYDNVARWTGVTVRFLDRKGREVVLKLRGLNARIVQHEVDHVNAMLYVDRVGKE